MVRDNEGIPYSDMVELLIKFIMFFHIFYFMNCNTMWEILSQEDYWNMKEKGVI